MIEKEKKIVESTSSRKEECDSDEDMALFMKRFKRIMKKDGYFNKNKRRGKIKRKSNNPCFVCGQVGHFIADCPNLKNKNKNKSDKKEQSKGKTEVIGEAHLGIVWDSSEESSSEDEGVATLAMEAHAIKPSLFGDLIDDEDDSIHTCFMAREAKVYPNSSLDDEDNLDDDEYENMMKELGKEATNK